MFETILVAVIGAGGAVVSAYIIGRFTRQDRVLDKIQVNVNSRLDKLLAQSKLDNTELDRLRQENDDLTDDVTDP
jgi:hypothetical protein